MNVYESTHAARKNAPGRIQNHLNPSVASHIVKFYWIVAKAWFISNSGKGWVIDFLFAVEQSPEYWSQPRGFDPIRQG